jgi:mRNA interferase MazF
VKQFKFGDVCLLKFPFTDAVQAKKRPAVLLSADSDGDGVFLRITTQLVSEDNSVILKSWQECGLLAPSCVKVNKFATLNLDLIERKLGALTESDSQNLYHALQDWLSQLHPN